MAITAIKESVTEEVNRELNRANEHFPLFHSRHEAMAVIGEEYEETAEALGELQSLLQYMWKETRGNNKVQISPFAAASVAMDVACEAIQTAAMLFKMEMSLGETRDDVAAREEMEVE